MAALSMRGISLELKKQHPRVWKGAWAVGVAILAMGVAVLFYSSMLLPWHTRWGTVGNEATTTLPGDSLVAHPKTRSTRAVTIAAPPSRIWPWIAQMGHGRGALYSYDWLENLVGCDMHSAESIHPEWQNIQPGDKVGLGPEGYPAYPVVDVMPGHALVLGAQDIQSWVFVLMPQADGTTRLLVRSQGDYEPTAFNFFIWKVMTQPLHFVMERKMLLGIRERAER